MITDPFKYQRDAGNAVVKSLRSHDGVMCVMATGLGKTFVNWMIAEHFVKQGYRFLFLAHRDTLIEQAVKSLKKFTGLDCGVEKAESTAYDKPYPIVVGSVQSMDEDRLKKYDRNRFNIISTDEGHLSAADSYLRIYDYFNTAKRIGFTATAYRNDSRNLQDVYEAIAFEFTLKRAIQEGLLCRIVSETIPIDCDLSSMTYSNGDYTAESCGSTIEPILDSITQKMVPKLANRHKTIAFLPLIKTSLSAAGIFSRHGAEALHVAGDSDNRKETIDWFEKYNKNLLCNPMFLSVGYDHPPIDTVLWLRPTTSTLSYTQGVGRGTRLCDGKEYLYLPDLIMNGQNHDLCRPSCLIAETQEMEEAMNELSSGGKPPMGLSELEADAHDLLIDRREAKLAKQIKENNTSEGKFDPVLGIMAVVNDAVSDWRPRVSEEAQIATPDQIRRLEEDGFDPKEWKRGYADTILKMVEDRSQNGLATPKQLRLLCRQHVKGAANLTGDQAKAKIEGLKRKWKYIAQHKKTKGK